MHARGTEPHPELGSSPGLKGGTGGLPEAAPEAAPETDQEADLHPAQDAVLDADQAPYAADVAAAAAAAAAGEAALSQHRQHPAAAVAAAAGETESGDGGWAAAFGADAAGLQRQRPPASTPSLIPACCGCSQGLCGSERNAQQYRCGDAHGGLLKSRARSRLDSWLEVAAAGLR